MTAWWLCVDPKTCATPCPCPTCGRALPPIGRDLPLSHLAFSACCYDAMADPAVNTRHIWEPGDVPIRIAPATPA